MLEKSTEETPIEDDTLSESLEKETVLEQDRMEVLPPEDIRIAE